MSVPPAKDLPPASARPSAAETEVVAKPDGPAAEPELPAAGAAPVGGGPISVTGPDQAAEDPGHWLYRLTAEQWLTAAENELGAAAAALAAKQQRAGVTHARRAAGMALNARLRVAADASYGRSYMEHLQALQKDPAISPELRDAATRLLAAPLTQQLVTLGAKGDTRPAELAAQIVEYARALVLGSLSRVVH